MLRFWRLSSLLLSVAFAQTSAQVIWEPPDWNFPQETKATVSKEMLSALHVSTTRITLEETPLDKVKQLIGGEIGTKGDAGEAMQWLCFRGTDHGEGWVLWLESGEIDGGSIGSFQWQSMPNNAAIDGRCHTLGGSATIKLGLPLKLGMTEPQLFRVLGAPSSKQGESLIYLHEHTLSLKGVPYDSSNIVMVRVRDGKITSIAASKTTSS